jgi:hypothetical protein
MTDTWANGGLVVYDWSTATSRRFEDPSLRGVPGNNITINGVKFEMGGASDGIAITPMVRMFIIAHLPATLFGAFPQVRWPTSRCRGRKSGRK